MMIDDALVLYNKLSKFLALSGPQYLNSKRRQIEHNSPNTYMNIMWIPDDGLKLHNSKLVEWAQAKRLTFREFCKAYNIEIIPESLEENIYG